MKEWVVALCAAAALVLGGTYALKLREPAPPGADDNDTSEEALYSGEDSEEGDEEVAMVSREEWGAREPRGWQSMPTPVPFVIIHHSYIPPACNLTCANTTREVQDMHMDRNGWDDIGYSFLVGGDSRVYAGRGWDRVGAHAPKYNDKSIGICVLGDWQIELPPEGQLRAVHELISLGVARGLVRPDYKLLGHRQTRPTECPGEALWREINTWDHFSPCPPPVEQAARPGYVPVTECAEKVAKKPAFPLDKEKKY